MNGELWIQTRITTTFQQYSVCVLMLITRKLSVVYTRPTYWMTAPLSAMSNLGVRAGCKIQLVSYGSNMHQSLSNKPFVCTYTHKSKAIGHRCMWTFYMSSDFSTIGNIPWVVRVAWDIWVDSYTAPDRHWSLSDTTLCGYSASLCIHDVLVRNYAWQQNSQTLLPHTTHKMMALVPIMHRFTCIRVKLVSYTTLYMVLLKLLKGNTILLDEFVAKQQEKRKIN